MKIGQNTSIILLTLILSLTVSLTAEETPIVSSGADNGGSKTIQVSRGSSTSGIALSWQNTAGKRYRLYRSTLLQGPWDIIGEVNINSYTDRTAEPGIKYWYRIQAIREGGGISMLGPEWGYRKMSPLKGEHFDSMMHSKNRNMPVISDTKQKNATVKELAYLEKYYINRIELSLIMMIARSYLNNGSIIILNTFDRHAMDYSSRQIFLTRNEQYMVKFYSKKLFRIYDSSLPLHHVLASISFGTGGNADKYSVTGLGIREKSQQWNQESEAAIDIQLPPTESDLDMDLQLSPYYGKTAYPFKNMIVSANGVPIQTLTIPRAGKYRVVIPHMNVTGNRLRLSFSFPDIQNSIDPGNGPRTIAFSSLTISERIFPQDLFTRLLSNAVFYCIPRGDKPVTRRDGSIKFIPYYEAIGMSTEYFKNYVNWRSHTIMLPTSNKELKKEMEKAEKNG